MTMCLSENSYSLYFDSVHLQFVYMAPWLNNVIIDQLMVLMLLTFLTLLMRVCSCNKNPHKKFLIHSLCLWSKTSSGYLSSHFTQQHKDKHMFEIMTEYWLLANSRMIQIQTLVLKKAWLKTKKTTTCNNFKIPNKYLYTCRALN